MTIQTVWVPGVARPVYKERKSIADLHGRKETPYRYNIERYVNVFELVQSGVKSARQIAGNLGVSDQTAYNVLKNLESEGLVTSTVLSSVKGRPRAWSVA